MLPDDAGKELELNTEGTRTSFRSLARVYVSESSMIDQQIKDTSLD
mgnify:CR=1 FL=1